MPTKNNLLLLPVFSCLLASTLWGLMWYPLRILEQLGVPGLWATLIIYLAALIIILPRLWRQHSRVMQQPLMLVMIGIFAGWTNLAFILAVLEGHIVRVLLLFYLSPVWAVLLGWLVLREHLSFFAWCIVFLAMAGAGIMLWHPDAGTLLPQVSADYLAISSGFAFAVTNVFIRKSGHIPIILKMGSTFLGVMVLSIVGIFFIEVSIPNISFQSVFIMIAVGCFGMIIMTFSAQYGVTHLPLYRSAVIFLFEVVVGAISAEILTEEVTTFKEWAGGILVMFSALLIALESINPDKTYTPESNNKTT